MVSSFDDVTACNGCGSHTSPRLRTVLTAAHIARHGAATTCAAQVSACLLLTECSPHLTCVIAADVADRPEALALVESQVVRFVASGWATQAEAELHVVSDGRQHGVCDPARRWWVPHHSDVPYRLVPLTADEHLRVRDHLASGRAWDLFKHIQLLYLAEDGFAGGRDILSGPPGYGSVVRPDRWYVTMEMR